MPWVEVTDSALHGNDRHRPVNEKEAENASLVPISRQFDQGESGGSGGNSITYKTVSKYYNYGNTSIASTTSIIGHEKIKISGESELPLRSYPFHPVLFSELSLMTGKISGLGVEPPEKVQPVWIGGEI